MEWFWNADIWLMPGVTWDDMKPTPENGLPDSTQLLPMAIILASAFAALRYFLLEPLIFKPFGIAIDIADTVHAAGISNNSSNFRKLYPSSKIVSKSNSKMRKHCDSCWELCYYILYCLYGIYAVTGKFWYKDIKSCWDSYPFQTVSSEMWWYYMIPLGYYTFMTIHLIYKPKKDFCQMFIHHVATLALITLSFTVNMVRAGSLILLVHECVDIPLQMAKICGYAKREKLKDLLFVVFLFTWIATRLIVFPFWIMKNTIFEAHLILDAMYPIYYIFNGLLIVLLFCHVLWTLLIIKIIVRRMQSNTVVDSRSDTESSDEGSHGDHEVKIKKT